MSDHTIAVDLDDPTAIFAEKQGEARIDEHELATLTADEMVRFTTALKLYIEMHPKLDVATLIHKGETDELVIRWRWRP
jgi:hypothetical protein